MEAPTISDILDAYGREHHIEAFLQENGVPGDAFDNAARDVTRSWMEFLQGDGRGLGLEELYALASAGIQIGYEWRKRQEEDA